MKVKVAEAVVAGRPVVTTPLGADGFSPALQRHLSVVQDRHALTLQAVETAMTRDTEVARAAFAAVLGWRPAVATYRNALEVTG
jgi:hypothetical protein